MTEAQNPEDKILLAVIEQGGYPDFSELYRAQGYRVEIVKSARKAISFIKKHPIAVLVAEFNFQSDFRDRTSSLESIMASVQHQKHIRVIIFIDDSNQQRFEKVSSRFNIYQSLTFPIDKAQLTAAIA